MKSRLFIPIFLGAVAVSLAAVPDGVRESVRSLSQKADRGDGEAIYNLARLHDIGYDSIEVDSARSTALYLEAADRGNAKAMNYLGFRYFKGEYVDKDIDSALFWLSKAVEAGDPGAANNLGYLYASGMAVEQDFGKAREWFGIAADAGIHSAEAQLADLFCEGLGGETDTIGALQLYRKAARGGIREAGIKRAELLKNMADRGDARAMALLGDAYSRGEGVPYNHQLSTEYFLKGALGGEPSAAFVIAELLEIFPDAFSEKNYSDIIRSIVKDEEIRKEMLSPQYWYEKAAAAGITNAEEATRNLFPVP
ncbi:MAG: sel1 repeat family protein [Muribaculaceae bacterium]|nr:sel1 repeat family protein [Muribaculaceae bacterium]